MLILSEYLSSAIVATGNQPEKIRVIPHHTGGGLSTGNLAIREYYTSNKGEKYTYMRETVIVTSIINNNNHLIVSVKLVAGIDAGNAFVNSFPINLVYKGGKYYQIKEEMDADGNSIAYDENYSVVLRDNNIDTDNLVTCSQLMPINSNEAVFRYYVEDSIVFEDGGKSTEYAAPQMKIPGWC